MRFPCLVRVCVDGPNDVATARAFLAKLASAFDLDLACSQGGDEKADSVMLTTPNLSLHVYSNNPMVTRARQLLGRGPLCAVTAVSFGDSGSQWQQKPIWSPTHPIVTNSPLSFKSPPAPPRSSASVFKELCIPAPTESLHASYGAMLLNDANSFEPVRNCPGVYCSSTISPRLDVRLFPALKMGITILSTPELIRTSPFSMSKLGSQLHRLYQLHLPEPLAQALCLQVTDAPDTHGFYSEGTEAVLDGTLPSLQSSRVILAQDKDDKVDPRIGSGNCWEEVREMAKKMPGKIAARSRT